MCCCNVFLWHCVFPFLTLFIFLFGDNSHGHGRLMCNLCSAQWEPANLQRAEGAPERDFARGVSLLQFFLPFWRSNPVIHLKTHQFPLAPSRRTACKHTNWGNRRVKSSQTVCVFVWLYLDKCTEGEEGGVGDTSFSNGEICEGGVEERRADPTGAASSESPINTRSFRNHINIFTYDKYCRFTIGYISYLGCY